MAAKKKSGSNGKSDGTRGINYKGKEIKFDSKPRPVKESFSQGGGPVPKVAAGAKKTLSLPAPKTKVVKATGQLAGGSPLGTSIAINPMNKKQIAGAAASMVGIGASGAKIVTKQIVSEGTKRLQRELSRELKSRSNKDIRSLPKSQREEIAYGRAMQRETPEEIIEDMAYPAQLRAQIAQSMKQNTKTVKKVRLPKIR